MMNIPFSPPDISEEEVKEVTEALKSGWITTGPKTKQLEKEVAELCGVNRAVCLNSQTACAEMTLRLLGVGPGDEVITSAYTYTASASVVCHVGAKLVLIDTQEDSLEMDYEIIWITGDTHGGWIHRLNMDSFPEQREMTKDDYVIVLFIIIGGFWIWKKSKNL